MQITCVDYHNTHADSLEKYVTDEKLSSFKFLWNDMEKMSFDEKWDRIFLNHVRPYIKEPVKLYKKLKENLTENGIFICTWGGGLLFQNLQELLEGYPQGAAYFHEKNQNLARKMRQQEEELNNVFDTVECRKYCLELRFENVEGLADYILSLMHVEVNHEEIRVELLHYLQGKVPKADIKVKRDTCLYLCTSGGENPCHPD